ncbi:MAG TPA: condensation domain-containing protein, partial [Thermoanaerobaculia bacterium]|nr:condensation domain-containing protein [Thermoanaerobaculia bacterium]
PVGLPLGNTSLYVMSRQGEVAPLGVVGELAIGGEGLARGYHRRPELTAERFVPDPFGAPGARLYRTGDLVRRLPEGTLEFLGRGDLQVKVRGFRIELGEIEAVLASHPAVRECAVVARQDGERDRELVGYVVFRPRPEEAGGLRAFLAAKLPPYMVPAVFVTLAALPLSPSGKVDRNALPAPRRRTVEDAGSRPRTPAETLLAGVWEKALGVAPARGDNFFELGGDSIRAAEVVFRAREAGLTVALRDCFRYQTLAELAAAVAAASGTPGGAAFAAEIPLTPEQRSFFSMGLAEPNRFTQSLLVALRGRCAPGLLARALGAVIARHAALQVHFLRGKEGEWRQELAPWLVPALQVLDLSPLPAAVRGAAVGAATARLEGGLDLERGPLLRALLCDLGEDGQRLFLLLHHLIADGASWRILLADLDAACRAVPEESETAPPPAAPLPIRQWAERLAGEAPSAAPAADREARRPRRRPGHAPAPLPLDYPAGPAGPAGREGADNTALSARVLTAELGEEETRALLVDVPALYRNRLEEALLSAVVQAFAGWTGEPRLRVDVEGSVREGAGGAELARTVGRISPLYQVLLELDRRERDPGAVLKSVKEQLRAARGDASGHGALRWPAGSGDGGTAAGTEPSAAAAPVAFRDVRPGAPGLPEPCLFAPAPERAGGPHAPGRQRRWLFEIEAGITGGAGGRLRWSWTYSANLHHARTVEGLIDRSLGALRSLIAQGRGAGAAVFTPADFPAARLSQKDLDKLMARIGGKRAPRKEKDEQEWLR